MSSEQYPAAPYYPEPVNGSAVHAHGLTSGRVRLRYAVHALLLLLTLITTSAMGACLVDNFRHNRPAFELERDMALLSRMWTEPALLLAGLPFSLCLMGILLAHEMGHFLACRYYRVDASLPYFLPAPSFIGTFGAFIRIRSPIYTKRVLFDVGIAGPLAGFVALLPVLAIGLAWSKIIPGIAHRGDLTFGTPALLWLLEKAILPGIPPADIYLHPVARAAWVGIFSTSLNLLPIGQLDGGHIIYSFLGEKHRLLSRVFTALLVPLGFFYWWGWLFWAAIMFFFGIRHPSIYDTSPMGEERTRLGWLALAVFLLTFTLAPVVANV